MELSFYWGNFVLSIIIFCFGFFIGRSLAYEKHKDILKKITEAHCREIFNIRHMRLTELLGAEYEKEKII